MNWLAGSKACEHFGIDTEGGSLKARNLSALPSTASDNVSTWQQEVDRYVNEFPKGSGWWPKCLLRPAHVNANSWSSIHLPTLRSGARYEMDTPHGVRLAHFRYRNFNERWNLGYANLVGVQADKEKQIRDGEIKVKKDKSFKDKTVK